MDELFEFPEDFAALSAEDLAAWIDKTVETCRQVAADPQSFVSADYSAEDLKADVAEAVDGVKTARAQLKTLTAEVEAAAEVETAEVELDEAVADDIAALAAKADDPGDEDDGDVVPDGDEDADGESVTASAVEPEPKPKNLPLPRPSASRRPPETHQQRVSLVAAAGFEGDPSNGVGSFEQGDTFPSMSEIAKVMESRRRRFGIIPEGTRGEKVPIVRAAWADLYPAERRLDGDPLHNVAMVASAIDEDVIRVNMAKRQKLSGQDALTASGGLCAPVTPYYQLMMVSTAGRPVRAALPSFNADRGGIRFARPATLASITTAVGIRTADEDAAGGTSATKTCQVVDCPNFEETDVDIIFHCLQFGNLGARTFPERVTQWNNLTLAAHARLAESNLLTGIDTASTQITGDDLGLGASATLPSQILAAAEGMRSRHRMDPNAVLRVMLPQWVLSLLVSDVYRSQFERFDMDGAAFVQLLRKGNVEPSFYMDSAAGRNQVFATQHAGVLETFPRNVVWYLFPEGSFLYLDGGTLELGLVRDSVLNKTNDFQIFGETFENVAYIGIESLAVSSATCDSGTVSLPHAVACPTGS